MSFPVLPASLLLMLMLSLLLPTPVGAQAEPAVPAAADAAAQPAPEVEEEGDGRPAWRSTAGYRFQAIAQTVADLQNLAHAMNLRELCANQRIPDAFVRAQLDRFGLITGREEDCQSLLDYELPSNRRPPAAADSAQR